MKKFYKVKLILKINNRLRILMREKIECINIHVIIIFLVYNIFISLEAKSLKIFFTNINSLLKLFTPI